MSEKVMVSVRLADWLFQAMEEAMRSEGWSLRRKSLWVSDALNELLDRGVAQLLADGVLSGHSLDSGGKEGRVRTFRLDDDLHLRLVSAVAEIRQRDPYLPAPQSALIRAAILGRLKGRDAA